MVGLSGITTIMNVFVPSFEHNVVLKKFVCSFNLAELSRQNGFLMTCHSRVFLKNFEQVLRFLRWYVEFIKAHACLYLLKHLKYGIWNNVNLRRGLFSEGLTFRSLQCGEHELHVYLTFSNACVAC